MEAKIDQLNEVLNVKQRVLRDDLKRLLIYWQLFKYSLDCIRTSDTIKEWAEEAKAAKNKSFVDFRKLAAEHLNVMNAMMFKMKSTMRPATWNAVLSTLTSEQVKEIDLLLNEITELKEHAIERITSQIKEGKMKGGIPLNDPEEQKRYEKEAQDGKEEL